MTEDLKKQIVTALEKWMIDHPTVSQNDVANSSGINAGYLLKMRKLEFNVTSGGKTVNIADKYFDKIAKFICFELKINHWPTRNTPQFSEIITKLITAREELETAVIIGHTGSGKTFALDTFKSTYPTEVFTIKAGSSDKLNDLIEKILQALGVVVPYRSVSARIGQIVLRLKIIREKGLKPVLAIDEAEYMKYSTLCAWKEIYDLLHKECALILLGTNELLTNIEKLLRTKKAGIAQLFRRIKFKIQHLPDVDTRFGIFTEGIPADVKRWLSENCGNYGELHDVMVPVLSESDRLKQPITLDFLKLVLGVAA